MSASAIERERERQQLLLEALLARSEGAALQPWLSNPPGRLQRGLQAYVANAGASAERALASRFPTVQALVGEESFGALARALWQAQPPERGDLACFGDGLPAFVEASEQLADVPYLADVARLDALLASAEQAADGVTDAASLQLLADTDPAQLRLVLAPGVALLRSAHPVLSIWRAHQVTADAETRLAEARAALAAGRSECALVWREGWRAQASLIDAPTANWTEALLQAAALSSALDRAGDAFDFEPWLMQALTQGWLLRAERLG